MNEALDQLDRAGSRQINSPHAGWVGAGSQIDPQVRLGPGCVLGRRVRIVGQVSLGANVQIGDESVLYGPLTVGDDCRIGRGTSIGAQITAGAARTTIIGLGGQIGRQVTILSGVTIGEAVFIKAGSGLLGDVPSHALVGDAPGVLLDFLCPCGGRLEARSKAAWGCCKCGGQVQVPDADIARVGHILLPGSETGEVVVRPSMYSFWMELVEF